MTQKYPDTERIALFTGSFDPFTVGHCDIVKRALGIFDRVIVCVGYNIDKTTAAESVQPRVEAIRRVYRQEPRVSVDSWSGLTIDYAREHGVCALLRGVRSVKDYEYERDMADVNRALGGIDTVILFAEPQYAWISSSLVRELQAHGRDTKNMLPAITD